MNRFKISENSLDLLLHLIHKNKIDIYDIPISLITKQYLEYLKFMKSVNIDFPNEFFIMAAKLTHVMLACAAKQAGFSLCYILIKQFLQI